MILVLAGIIVTKAAAQSSSVSQPIPGFLHGIVLDDRGQPAPGGEIRLFSRENEFTTTAGPDGKFTLSVPPDIYRFRLSRPDAILFQRSALVIGPFMDLYIQVHPVYRKSLAPGTPDTAVHYFSYSGPGRLQWGAVLRSVDGLDQKMLSYDSLSVYGKSITCDRRSLRCAVEGEAIAEIGTSTGVRVEKAPSLDVDLINRKIFVTQGEAIEEIPF